VVGAQGVLGLASRGGPADVGVIQFNFDWDFEGAGTFLGRGIAMGPGSYAPYLEYAEYLCAVSCVDEALEVAERARELDPVSPTPTHVAAFCLMLETRYPEALAELEPIAIQLRTSTPLARSWAGRVYAAADLVHEPRFAEFARRVGVPLH
jgi:hypothetical protein